MGVLIPWSDRKDLIYRRWWQFGRLFGGIRSSPVYTVYRISGGHLTIRVNTSGLYDRDRRHKSIHDLMDPLC